ncbi:hypothetical protein [Methylacidimicrobium cyclopophantes]|nr:hypothetical protein [Methylacidimicrobium cyclopophantes]
MERIREEYESWQSALAAQELPYVDTHCSTFTPSSFTLLIEELRYLGLIEFDLLEVVRPPGLEFFAHLQRRSGAPLNEDRSAFYARRAKLLFQIKDELAENAPAYRSLRNILRKTEVERDVAIQEKERALTPLLVNPLRPLEQRLRPLWKPRLLEKKLRPIWKRFFRGRESK